MSTLNCSTLVIGAGMSGVTAALNLLKNGHEDLLVVESLDRIGGRMNTIQVGERHIELGAQWIHGQVNNPVYEFARDQKLLEDGYDSVSELKLFHEPPGIDAFKQLIVEPSVQDRNELAFYLNEDGTKINPKISIALFNIAEETLNSFCDPESTPETLSLQGDRRFVDVFREEFKKNVDKHLGSLLMDVKGWHNSAEVLAKFEEIVNSVFYNRCKLEGLIAGCTEITDLSFKNYTTYKMCDGLTNVELKYGYKAVLDAMIGPFKAKFDKRLRLNHHVKSVCVCEKQHVSKAGMFGAAADSQHSKYTEDENKVVVKLTDRSSEEPKDVVIICDRVLCTMSLGFLKKNLNTLFEPLNLIDDAKRLAISRVGFGTVNKIYFFYESSFWNDCGENVELSFCPAIRTSDPADLTPLVTKTWVDTISCASTVYKRKDCLVFWVSGNQTEPLSDQFLSLELTKLLRKYMKNDQIPEPQSIIRSAWSSHPNFRGSYSYMPIGAYSTDLDQLARPLPSPQNPMILFAGEHTHASFFSTVHGAHLSGLRESARILDLAK